MLTDLIQHPFLIGFILGAFSLFLIKQVIAGVKERKWATNHINEMLRFFGVKTEKYPSGGSEVCELLMTRIAKRSTFGYWEGIYKRFKRRLGKKANTQYNWVPYLYKQYKQIDFKFPK